MFVLHDSWFYSYRSKMATDFIFPLLLIPACISVGFCQETCPTVPCNPEYSSLVDHSLFYMNGEQLEANTRYITIYWYYIPERVIVKYLHFHCVSLNEPLHLRCRSYLHEQIDLSHTHIRTIWVGQRQRHPKTLLVYWRLLEVKHVSPWR